MGDEISGGQSKFYRMDCFREIGAFVEEVMWDVIDCHRCRMQGWIACQLGRSTAALCAPEAGRGESKWHADRQG